MGMERLIVFLSMLLIRSRAAGGMPEGYQFSCRDPEASYTFNNCSASGEALVGKGCYYDDSKSQYRQCGKICNDVVDGSLGEEQCKNTEGCQNFLYDYCTLSAVTTPTTAGSSTTEPSGLSDEAIVGIVVAVLVVIGLVGIIIYCLWKKRTEQERPKNGAHEQEMEEFFGSPTQETEDAFPLRRDNRGPNEGALIVEPVVNADNNDDPQDQDHNMQQNGHPPAENGGLANGGINVGGAAGDNGEVAAVEGGSVAGCHSHPENN